MEILRKHIAQARRLLGIQTWMGILPWTVFIAFSIGFIALLTPKIWYIPYTFESWSKVWLGGAAIGALFTSLLIAWLRFPTLKQSALEIDQRFGLRERVSSAIDLDEASRETPVGEALVNDAAAKLDRVDLRDRFPIRPSPSLPWVLLPALGCIALFWVPDADLPGSAEIAASLRERLQNVKAQTKPVLEQVKKLRTDLEEKGLQESAEEFKKLERKLDELQNAKELDTKKLLSDFNEIKKEMEQRKDGLKSPDSLQKAMEGLKDLEKGPGDKVADAMKNGEFQQAQKEVEKLLEKMRANKLSEQEKKQLADQLAQMGKAIEQMQQQQEELLEQLREELKRAEKEGDLAKAGQLRKEMEKLENAISKAQKSGKVAQKLASAAAAMKNGDAKGAEEALEGLAEELDDLAADAEAMEELEDLLEDLQNAKQASNCKSCTGQGCEKCNGGGGGMGQAGKGGKGKRSLAGRSRPTLGTGGSKAGVGTGQGEPEDELKTKDFDAQVRDQVRKGEKILGGKVKGPNRAGMTLEEVRAAVQSATPEDPDAVESIAIPKAQREQQREYFERLRKQ